MFRLKGLLQKLYTNAGVPKGSQKVKTFGSLNEPISITNFYACQEIFGNVKEKLTRKTCFCGEEMNLAPLIHHAKFSLAASL